MRFTIFIVAQLSRALPATHYLVRSVHADMVLELEVDDLTGMTIVSPGQIIRCRLDQRKDARLLQVYSILLLKNHDRVTLRALVILIATSTAI